MLWGMGRLRGVWPPAIAVAGGGDVFVLLDLFRGSGCFVGEVWMLWEVGMFWECGCVENGVSVGEWGVVCR